MGLKWIFGKQDWKTFERGLENCYLMTNGLGGFSSLTMTGAAARNDHAFFMACVKAPNNRLNMVHRLCEQLVAGEENYVLSSQEFADGRREEGYRHLSEFSYEDNPVWRFLVNGVEIIKEAGMKHGENAAAVCYRVKNRSRSSVRFTVTPFYQFVPKGKDMEPERGFICRDGYVESEEKLYYLSDGREEYIDKTEKYYYSYDVCDGRRETGCAKACHCFFIEVKPGEEETLHLVFSMDQICADKGDDAEKTARKIISEMKDRRDKLQRTSGFCDPCAAFLAKSADQFLSRRESTDGLTILAGFPFFEDWGRDTMIALPGICLSTHRYGEAKSILRTFAQYERDGLMPNLFPEGENLPMYNTADAALLFINCVWLYMQETGDREFLEEMYPVMEKIIRYYQRGTDHGIHMDTDGLIMAGEGMDQVTWMDVRAGDILPTARHGKPVEINAYWYNALCIMSESARLLEKEPVQYESLAEKVKTAFTEKFWMEEKHCLKDVLSGTKADAQIRCNQIWAVSMPFTMLDEVHERQVVDTVFEKLYTPYGLRTLEQADEEFHGFYGGEMLERDLAYHQGTVWAFPLGAYYLAYLKVMKYSQEAKACVREQLEVLEAAMREGCIGQLPEIYDGENPVSSKGCFAQAWSVGELLRVYGALECI